MPNLPPLDAHARRQQAGDGGMASPSFSALPPLQTSTDREDAEAHQSTASTPLPTDNWTGEVPDPLSQPLDNGDLKASSLQMSASRRLHSGTAAPPLQDDGEPIHGDTMNHNQKQQPPSSPLSDSSHSIPAHQGDTDNMLDVTRILQSFPDDLDGDGDVDENDAWIKDFVKGIDSDHDGCIGALELLKSLQGLMEDKRKLKNIRLLTLAAVLVCFMFLGLMIGIVVGGIQTMKEMQTVDGVIVDKTTGTPVQV